MKLKQLSAIFGENLKWTEQSKNFRQSLRMMVVTWRAIGLNCLKNHTLEVVVRWLLGVIFKCIECCEFTFTQHIISKICRSMI